MLTDSARLSLWFDSVVAFWPVLASTPLAVSSATHTLYDWCNQPDLCPWNHSVRTVSQLRISNHTAPYHSICSPSCRHTRWSVVLTSPTDSSLNVQVSLHARGQVRLSISAMDVFTVLVPQSGSAWPYQADSHSPGKERLTALPHWLFAVLVRTFRVPAAPSA